MGLMVSVQEWTNPKWIEVGQLWKSPPGEGVPDLDHVVAVDGPVVAMADGSTVWTEAMLTRPDYHCVGLEIDGRRMMVGELIDIGGNIGLVRAVLVNSALRVVSSQREEHLAEVRILPVEKAFVDAIQAKLSGTYRIGSDPRPGVRWRLRRVEAEESIAAPAKQISKPPNAYYVDGIPLRRTDLRISGGSVWTDGDVTVAWCAGDSDGQFIEAVRMARKAMPRRSAPADLHRQREAKAQHEVAMAVLGSTPTSPVTADDVRAVIENGSAEALVALDKKAGVPLSWPLPPSPWGERIPREGGWDMVRARERHLAEYGLTMATGRDLDNMAALVGIDAERFRREAPLREIGSILAEDARQHPEFATARLAGVMAALEHRRLYAGSVAPSEARAVLWELHRYESVRGGTKTPERSVDPALHTRANASVQAALIVYERARGGR